jgi:three-Cys-motif partner protein
MSMKQEPYIWTSDREPPILEAHSRAKHDVLDAYLRTYVEVLTVNRRQEALRLTVVDGFAGGGEYLDSKAGESVPGSPMLILQAIAAAETLAKSQRRKDFHIDAQYIFVERNVSAVDYLRETIHQSPFRPLLDDKIRIHNGLFINEFDSILEAVKRHSRSHRVIFVLDQYGYKDVPFSLLKRIFTELHNPEVVLTFATDWLIDYLSDDPSSRAIVERVGLQLPFESIQDLKRKQGMDWKRYIQLALHNEIHLRSGASFYAPFFIKSVEAHRSYWLIHLSQHERARDVMTQLHWNQHNYFQHF